MKLYAIRISNITNEMLIKVGWNKGMYVKATTAVYTGQTFKLASQLCTATFRDSRAGIEKVLNRKNSFVGVEFEIVEFISKD